MSNSNVVQFSSGYPALTAILPTKEKICLSTTDGQLLIRKQDISVLQADNNYCNINYNGKKVFCSQTLKQISSRINLTNFIKVHRSYVVNVNKISSISSAFTDLVMEDGSKIPISRNLKKGFKSQLAVFFD